jgi:hypothetical protein
MSTTNQINFVSPDLWTPETGFNPNPLDPTQFKISFSRIPRYTFSCQEISLPSVDIQEVEQPTSKLRLTNVGDSVQYGQLNMTFIIDENLYNYKEVYKWMIDATATGNRPFAETASFSEAILTLGGKNHIRLVNIWPGSLGQVTFLSTPGIIEYATCPSVWHFDYFEFMDSVTLPNGISPAA